MSLRCMACGAKTKATNAKYAPGGLRRRYICRVDKNHRFTTIEVVLEDRQQITNERVLWRLRDQLGRMA